MSSDKNIPKLLSPTYEVYRRYKAADLSVKMDFTASIQQEIEQQETMRTNARCGLES
jgi:hypothetical protein